MSSRRNGVCRELLLSSMSFGTLALPLHRGTYLGNLVIGSAPWVSTSISKSSSSAKISSDSSSSTSRLMAFPLSYKVSLFLYGFLGEMCTRIIVYLLFFGLDVLGDLGTSTITATLYGASSTTSISCADSSGVDIILFRRSCVSFENLSNIELALKASKFAHYITLESATTEF